MSFLTTAALVTVGAFPTLGSLLRDFDASTTVSQAGVAPDAGPALPDVTQTSQEAKDLGDGTRLAAWKLVDGVKVFDLVLASKKHETEPGRVKEGLSVNGSIPAPTIRVNEGDKLRFNVVNKMKEGTSIHWHGMDLPNEQDGVPGITQKTIPPNGQKAYEWTAISTGTHWYHSHMHGDQEGRGVFGLLDVVPLVGDIASDRDYTMIFSDGALGFVINGKSFPATTRMAARVGERVRIRVIGAGPEMIHSIHLHLGFFEVMAQDGNRLPQPYKADTLVLGVGQTFDLLWVPTREGAWMMHCHIFSHSETQAGMTGMATLFDVAPANPLTAPRVPPAGSGVAATPAHGTREQHSS
ncbi:multicopper oxidase family protein [Sporichthya polymorpha]|uniref:multicopper oxidase family protein n=1 Tax=Sporichthya polymorpha TaxID=35751 RepID=UPI00036A1D76|nr:multicopper oxidase domain-containing protein [Sporichthya polymorpha]